MEASLPLRDAAGPRCVDARSAAGGRKAGTTLGAKTAAARASRGLALGAAAVVGVVAALAALVP
jgi:hypothetical protein